jgi:hypothetical protein
MSERRRREFFPGSAAKRSGVEKCPVRGGSRIFTASINLKGINNRRDEI